MGTDCSTCCGNENEAKGEVRDDNLPQKYKIRGQTSFDYADSA